MESTTKENAKCVHCSIPISLTVCYVNFFSVHFPSEIQLQSFCLIIVLGLVHLHALLTPDSFFSYLFSWQSSVLGPCHHCKSWKLIQQCPLVSPYMVTTCSWLWAFRWRTGCLDLFLAQTKALFFKETFLFFTNCFTCKKGNKKDCSERSFRCISSRHYLGKSEILSDIQDNH